MKPELPVSVQIITLNEEANIADCITAVKSNFPAEILVIDGGSIDRTVDLAQDLGARVIHGGRLRRGESRQLGYMSTELPFVAMVDADDRIPENWLHNMLNELIQGGYGALQSGLKVENNVNFFTNGWNSYFKSSLAPKKESTIIGHPSIYLTACLQTARKDIGHEGEDTQLSRDFHKRGIRQGISHLKASRIVPISRQENIEKWLGYGRGYFDFVCKHPNRVFHIIFHIWIRIPFIRGLLQSNLENLNTPKFNFMMSFYITKGLISSAVQELSRKLKFQKRY